MQLRPFALERYFAHLEFTSRYLLSSSDCEALTTSELLAMADPADRDAFLTLKLGYTESDGLPELREQVGRHLGIANEHVVIAAPEEAIYLTMRALLAPGDHVITTFPGYQSLYEIARAVGCRVSFWTPEETADGWRFHVARLDALAASGARAIVVNFPHNPTGAVLDGEDWERVLRIAERADAHLVADEMYCGFEPESARRPSAAAMSRQSIAIGGLSKSFGLPGLRIGWIATRDPAVLDRVRAYHDYTTICNSAPSERLALIALKHGPALQERCRSIIARNLPLFESFLSRHPATFAYRRPAAGPVAFVRLQPGSASAFCEVAARMAGIMLAPASMFDWGDTHIRFGLGRLDFPDALRALEEYLARRE